MAIRKNKKFIDPRYFLHETTYRDLNEQSTTINVSDLTALNYGKLKGSSPGSNTGTHPIFKVPNENLYYQLRDIILYNKETGKDEHYGFALDYATTPGMGGSMVTSIDRRRKEDAKDLADPAAWMAGILSKKGHDQLELVQKS